MKDSLEEFVYDIQKQTAQEILNIVIETFGEKYPQNEIVSIIRHVYGLEKEDYIQNGELKL
jgi:hypothetical protein